MFLLSVVGATDNTTCKGAPRWAPCSVRVVRGLSADLFAGKYVLAAVATLWRLPLRAVCLVPNGGGRTTQPSRAFLGGPLEVFVLCGCSWRSRFGVLQCTDVFQAYAHVSAKDALASPRFPRRGFGLHGTWGWRCLKLSCPSVHDVGSKRRLGFFGSPGASRADFVSVRVVPLPLLRRVRGGFARHGGDTRPRRVLWRHATRSRRDANSFACSNSFRSRLLHVEFV